MITTKSADVNLLHAQRGEELIFVVYEGYEDGYTAVEGNVGLVAMGKDPESLKDSILAVVDQHFSNSFNGIIRMRTFTDRIITAKQTSETFNIKTIHNN